MLAVLILALLTFCVINAATMLLFSMDKQRARAGVWRISEANLLAMAVIGGTPGALLARSLFRHKPASNLSAQSSSSSPRFRSER